VQRHIQRARHGVFPAVLIPRQEDGEALLEARGVRFPQHTHDFRIGEPLGDILPRAQAGAQLSAADVEGAHAGGDLVVGSVFVAVGQVDHLLEGHHFDAELLSVLFDCVLCVVGAVEVLSGGVLAWTGVVAADDEVRGAVVFADDGVPDCFSGAAHSHCEGQEAEDCHAVWIAGEKGLVDADAGEVVDVAWFREADDRVDEDVCLAGAGGADGQFAVGAVHGVAGLEGDDAGPAQLFEVDAQFGGGVAQGDVVVVVEAVDGGDFAADVIFLGDVVEMFDGRVFGVAAEDLFGFFLSVED